MTNSSRIYDPIGLNLKNNKEIPQNIEGKIKYNSICLPLR